MKFKNYLLSTIKVVFLLLVFFYIQTEGLCANSSNIISSSDKVKHIKMTKAKVKVLQQFCEVTKIYHKKIDTIFTLFKINVFIITIILLFIYLIFLPSLYSVYAIAVFILLFVLYILVCAVIRSERKKFSN
jgi:hypothetical protein